MKRDTGHRRDVTRNWRPATQAVRGGTLRSEFGETSEPIYLTSGYSYDCAEDAAARFRGEQQGMTYSRLQNPTVAMLEERLCLLEGAEGEVEVFGQPMVGRSERERTALRLKDVGVVFQDHLLVPELTAVENVELPLVISDHADWDELTRTIEEIAPQEVWVTHGREDALVHWCSMRQIRARALDLVGYEDEAEE